MRLLEYQGKEILRRHGVATPQGRLARTPAEAREAAAELGPVVVKVQIPSGGRGKAGGIRPAADPVQAGERASELLGSTIKGFPVETVLVEEKVALREELYLGLTIDNRRGAAVLMFCASGGMDIEEVAQSHPESVYKLELPAGAELKDYEARQLIRKAGFQGKTLVRLAQVAAQLYQCFSRYDLVVAEINPLGILADGQVVAADCKMEVDDNSLFRHPEFGSEKDELQDPLEREAREIGVTYIKLDGDIGIIASGAGLGMNTMDLILAAGHRPANFLETGGGITRELMRRAVQLVARHEGVRGLIVNLYGGVNPLVAAAEGVVDGVSALPVRLPVVVKALGNQQGEAHAVLESAGIPVVKSIRTEDAVAELVRQLEGQSA
ncbi:ADP-forming succinate--CoA ligase subunit beta [Gelria sp. Kuro-4]|uniref:ADP-forming succinate--CoA ligase subunit beta n=1 Tax=Gelria sp. Kuro-4 TaxID=2796927 RepID=UPI001BF04C0E|nr:ADP-forming succinate--CoA ligase subunit beta [Gelria sp. Kuro-4]BCV24512.1 succinate--CoA ligase [ADP-forming] subunit beta [Gelria sp. Kuro-4]